MTQTKLLKKGEYIYREGDPANEFYLVMSGSLRATRIRNHIERFKRGRVIAGEVVGEASLFDKSRRTFNVQAEQDSEVAVIRYDDLLKDTSLPLWASALFKAMIDRYRHVYVDVKYDDDDNYEDPSETD